MTSKERARDVDRPEHRTATGRPAERRTRPRRVTVPTGNAIREQPTTNKRAGAPKTGTAYTPLTPRSPRRGTRPSTLPPPKASPVATATPYHDCRVL